MRYYPYRPITHSSQQYLAAKLKITQQLHDAVSFLLTLRVDIITRKKVTMFFTEIRTKDEKRGDIVIDEEINNILKDVLTWFHSNKLTPKDMKVPEIVHWETCQSIGTIEFEASDRASFNPYEKPVPYVEQGAMC